MKKLKVFLIVFSVFMLGQSQSYADDLQQFFRDLHTLSGDFSQHVEGAALKSAPRSKGVFAIMRPGKFRWEYREPYQQKLISDGARIWIYDVDLEQLTLKKWTSAVSDTPAELLAGNEALDKSFNVQALPVNGAETAFELSPKKTDTGFSKIKLVFVSHELKKMILLDGLGQTTTLEFSHMQRNASVDVKQFTFTPPKGVDVYKTE